MLRCAELNLHDADLVNMSMGMVYDLLVEKANDQYKYPYIATQDDIKRFFG